MFSLEQAKETLQKAQLVTFSRLIYIYVDIELRMPWTSWFCCKYGESDMNKWWYDFAGD